MRLKIIVNPIAHCGNVRRIVSEIEDFFKNNCVSYSIDFTTKPHEATNLSSIASQQDYDVVVAVGGDGTVNEVVNGIMGSNTALAIIPAGASNDFCKELNISRDIRNACRLILEANKRRIDIGKVNDRYFINVAGVGLDAQVSDVANQGILGTKGLLLYTASLFKVLAKCKPSDFSISLDGKLKRVRAWLVAVGNGKQYGGGMKIVPTADINDGMLDICVIKDVHKLSVLYYLPMIIQGKHLSLSDVAIYRAKEVEIKALGCLGHVDGEILKGDIFRFSLVHDAIDVIVPNANANKNQNLPA